MSLHKITTSLDDKLLKFDSIYKNNEFSRYIEPTSYVYHFKYQDYTLIVPCSVIFNAYYSFRKPLLKASLTGNLHSFYFKFKYNQKSKIDIHIHRKYPKKLIPFVCQFLIDDNVRRKFIYIFFQKITNNNVFDYNTIKCFFPYYGTFDLHTSSITIHHPVHKEICIIRDIHNNLLLDNYGIEKLNVHYKNGYSVNIFEPIDKREEVHKLLNYMDFVHDLKEQNILPFTPLIKEQLPFPLNKQLYDATAIINLEAYKYKKGYLFFLFIDSHEIKENLLFFYLKKKKESLKEIENIIEKRINQLKLNQINDLKKTLADSFFIQELNIQKYYLSRYQINLLFKNCLDKIIK